jgi:translation initiation factor IF-3
MIIRFVLTKTTSFRFMSVRLIGRNSIRFGYRLKGDSVRFGCRLKGGSVATPAFGIKFYTDYRTEISRLKSVGGRWQFGKRSVGG